MKESTFVQGSTLGGKAKPFRWKVDEVGDLLIERKFDLKSSPEPTVHYTKFSVEEIQAIAIYVEQNGWTDLANNISKLGNGTEKEGIGKFLYNDLNCDITKCQASSQLSAIFTHAGIWEHNGKSRSMQFCSEKKTGESSC
jgi:hypothetical protein